MPNIAKLSIYAAIFGFLAFWCVVWFRAVRKTRRLQTQYRNASPEDRAALERRMETERGLAEYMQPLPWWEVVSVLAIIVLFVILKAVGYL
jgi:hypothetical protein